VLFREGEQGDQMFVLQSGRVRLTRRGRKGVQELVTLGPGEFSGEMAILNNRPRKNAEIAVRMILRMAKRLDEANQRIEILTHREPLARLVLALLGQADLLGAEQEDGGVLVPLEREELPKLTGLTEAEVNEVVARLSRLGMLEDGDLGIVIKDRARLTQFLDYRQGPET
jgi:CRP-like cAMP-binding protein